MRHLNHLPIWRDANRLLVAIEQAVRRFPRYHKYTLGTDLRRQAMNVCRLILRAADKGEDQIARVGRVVDAVDDLKLQVQLGKELKAFASFQRIPGYRRAGGSGGQAERGWRKRLATSDGQYRARV